MNDALRTGRWICISALLGTAAHAAAAAPGNCDGSSDPCSFDLGRITVSLAQGAASYSAGAEFLNGNDGSYVVSPSLPTLALQQSGTTEGFSFLPGLQLAVGGSGINGYHELHGWFEFTGLSFQAKPGWRIDALRFEVTGSRNWVGDGTGWFGVPIPLDVVGSSFSGSGAINPDDASLRAELGVSASYQEGPDGSALNYGYATSSFDTARFVATVSAVPEPGTVLLWLGGAAMLWAWGARSSARRMRR